MKFFKKLVCGVLCVSLVLVFTACGGNTEKPATLADQTETEVVTTESVTETETETETQTEVSDDERYLQNLADALEARWKTKPSGNRSAEELGLDEFKAYLHECINAEKAVLQPCDSFNFSTDRFGISAVDCQFESNERSVFFQLFNHFLTGHSIGINCLHGEIAKQRPSTSG